MALVVAGTDFIQMPAGTTAQRPASPIQGMQRYNTTLGYTEVYNGTAWVGMAEQGTPVIADGSVTDPKISNDLVNGTVWYPIKELASDGPSTGAASTWQNVVQFRCLRGGTFQSRARLFNGDNSATLTLSYRILANSVVVATSSGVAIGPFAAGNTSTGSFSLSRGQVVQIQTFAQAAQTIFANINALHIGLNAATCAIQPFTPMAFNGAGATTDARWLEI